MKRCIMIFLNFDNDNVIKDIRMKYDPTFELVKPHITLVFPFESTLSKKQIEEHIDKTLNGVKCFEVELQGIESKESFGNYIFLEVKKGVQELTNLHENLYTGILEKFLPNWLNSTKFIPHMTVGNLKNKEDVLKAIEELKVVKDKFRAKVDIVSVEIMYDDGSSEIELIKRLN